VGYGIRHVQRIQKEVRAEGLSALKPSYKGGGRQLMSTEKENAILSQYEQTIGIGEIKQAISQEVGRPVADGTIYSLLHWPGWKAKRPRPQHPQADVEAQTLFKKTGRPD